MPSFRIAAAPRSTSIRAPFVPAQAALALASLLLATPASAVSIALVGVTGAGNAPDVNGFGSVAYEYAIGQYEVTLAQYAEFLNAVARTDAYGLYSPAMGSDPNVAGIARSGASGSYDYSVVGSGNRPVTYVNWFDAARFTNWLANGQPTGPQSATTTEQGTYALNGALSGVAVARSAGWSWGLPSDDEWYKAAYHQPAA